MLNNNISFGANIKLNEYLNEAIHLVDTKNNMDEVPLSQRAEFARALELITQDRSMDTFEIKGVEGTKVKAACARPAEILIDGVPYETLGAEGGFRIFDGNQCMQHVINFARKKYGELSSNLIETSKALEKQAAEIHKKTEAAVHFLTGTSKYKVFNNHYDYVRRNPELEELGLF